MGRGAARQISQLGALARLFRDAVTSWLTLPRAGRRVARRMFASQVWFTAVEAIPLVIVLGSILSYLGISQAVQELGRLNATAFPRIVT